MSRRIGNRSKSSEGKYRQDVTFDFCCRDIHTCVHQERQERQSLANSTLTSLRPFHYFHCLRLLLIWWKDAQSKEG